MPHPAPTTPAEAKYTDTDLEPIRDALAALANGDFRARGRRYSEGTRGGDSVMLADIGSLLDEVAALPHVSSRMAQIIGLHRSDCTVQRRSSAND